MHDEAVHPLVPELIGKKQLAFGIIGSVHEEGIVVTSQQRAANADTQ